MKKFTIVLLIVFCKPVFASTEWYLDSNYYLNSGTLDYTAIAIGYEGTGKLYQTGKSNTCTVNAFVLGMGWASESYGYWEIREYFHPSITNVSQGAVIGYAGDAEIKQLAGTTSITNLMLGYDGSSDPTLTGGQGIYNLLGGSLSVNTFEINGSCYMNIEDGTFTLTGDQTDLISGYVDTDKILAYNGSGGIETTTYTDSGQVYTLVTAVPEPATILLLGLGILALRKEAQ